jgi:DNA-binding MarR family transcriptional regulator
MTLMQDDRTPGADRSPVHEATSLLREIQQISDEFEGHMGRSLTVNPTDLKAMEHLIMSGPLSPTQIASRLGVSTAAATVVIDRLTTVGHVTRTANPTDRRGIVVVPSPASVTQAMGVLMPMVMGIDRVIHEFAPEDQEIITQYLRRVVDVYREQLSTE